MQVNKPLIKLENKVKNTARTPEQYECDAVEKTLSKNMNFKLYL